MNNNNDDYTLSLQEVMGRDGATILGRTLVPIDLGHFYTIRLRAIAVRSHQLYPTHDPTGNRIRSREGEPTQKQKCCRYIQRYTDYRVLYKASGQADDALYRQVREDEYDVEITKLVNATRSTDTQERFTTKVRGFAEMTVMLNEIEALTVESTSLPSDLDNGGGGLNKWVKKIMFMFGLVATLRYCRRVTFEQQRFIRPV